MKSKNFVWLVRLSDFLTILYVVYLSYVLYSGQPAWAGERAALYTVTMLLMLFMLTTRLAYSVVAASKAELTWLREMVQSASEKNYQLERHNRALAEELSVWKLRPVGRNVTRTQLNEEEKRLLEKVIGRKEDERQYAESLQDWATSHLNDDTHERKRRDDTSNYSAPQPHTYSDPGPTSSGSDFGGDCGGTSCGG